MDRQVATTLGRRDENRSISAEIVPSTGALRLAELVRGSGCTVVLTGAGISVPAAHEALAELERRGLIEGVVTQNIDRLHRAAGSRNVVEVHGSIETSSCRRCAASFEIEEVEGLFDEDGVAVCATCGGAVKPDVVLFGELLPESAMVRARDLAERAELMICVGSSLAVHPVAGLPQLTLERGGRLAIVTKGETPYDDAAELRLGGEVDAELESLLAALG